MESLDLSREVAEKVLKRAMAPIREVLDVHPIVLENADHVELQVGTLRELDRDLGTLGVAMANRYREQVEYQTALGVMSAENTRLHTVLDELVTLVERYRVENGELIKGLSNARNSSDKIKESSMRGF